jgi:hypothetical protein
VFDISRHRIQTCRLKGIVKLDHASRSGLQIFGIASLTTALAASASHDGTNQSTYVCVDARKRAVLAMDIVAEATSATEATGYQRMQNDLIANFEACHCIAYGMDPASILMSNGIRKCDL